MFPLALGGLLAGAGSLIGGLFGANAAESAADVQADAANNAVREQRNMFDITNEQQKPYREAGYGALRRIQDLIPTLTSPITEKEIRGLPGFDFAINQGTGAARSAVNAFGGGSNADRAAQKFASDYVLSNALPQVIAQRKAQFEPLASLAGIGQNAQNATSTLAGTTATNIGNGLISGGTARGAGYVGAGNALGGAASNIGNLSLISSLLQQQPPQPYRKAA